MLDPEAAADAVIQDEAHWVDPKPPACESCVSVRFVTRGRMGRCRWCSGELDALLAESAADAESSRHRSHKRAASG